MNKRDVRAGIKGIAVTQCTSERFIETRSIIRRLASEKEEISILLGFRQFEGDLREVANFRVRAI